MIDSTLLRCGVGGVAVQDQKANTTLTILSLWSNKVGDAGATALADALQATVFDVWSGVVPGHVLLVSANVASHGDVSSWRRQVVVPVCVAASGFDLRHSFMRIVLKLM